MTIILIPSKYVFFYIIFQTVIMSPTTYTQTYTYTQYLWVENKRQQNITIDLSGKECHLEWQTRDIIDHRPHGFNTKILHRIMLVHSPLFLGDFQLTKRSKFLMESLYCNLLYLL